MWSHSFVLGSALSCLRRNDHVELKDAATHEVGIGNVHACHGHAVHAHGGDGGVQRALALGNDVEHLPIADINRHIGEQRGAEEVVAAGRRKRIETQRVENEPSPHRAVVFVSRKHAS